MASLISALRDILGIPSFLIQSGSGSTWDYGAMLEYLVAGILLITCVSWVFRLIKWLFSN